MATNRKKLKCICHKVCSAKGLVTPFSSKSWKKFQEAAPIWHDHIYDEQLDRLKMTCHMGVITGSAINGIQMQNIWRDKKQATKSMETLP